MDDKPEVRTFKLNQIRRDGGTQPRAIINQTTVADYAEDMKRGDKFDPVKVFYDGTDYWLADGFHRMAALEILARPEVSAEVHQGTQRDAILFSVGANATHGLRRTNEDKRRAVMRLLSDSEWVQWSNREIARRCGVDETMVRRMRDEATAVKPQSDMRKGGDGRTINTANIGTNRPPTSDQLYRASLDPNLWYAFDMLKSMVITPGFLSQMAAQRQYPDRGRFTIAKANFLHQHSNFRIVTTAEWLAETERTSVKNDPVIADMMNLPGNTTAEEPATGVTAGRRYIIDWYYRVLIDGNWPTPTLAREAFPDERRFLLMTGVSVLNSVYKDLPIITPEQWDERESARDAQREEDPPFDADKALDEITGDDDPANAFDASLEAENDAAYDPDIDETSNAVEEGDPEWEADGPDHPLEPDIEVDEVDGVPAWFLELNGYQIADIIGALETIADALHGKNYQFIGEAGWEAIHGLASAVMDEGA